MGRRLICQVVAIALGVLVLKLVMPVAVQADGPTIQNIATNEATYSNGEIPQYEKFEITFQVDTVAQSLQLPYDAAPPPGVEPDIGITIDALFTPDNWQTVYQQPAFYYQEFQDEIKSGKAWFYPTGNAFWKVRFAPAQAGTWQFKLAARDAGGLSETPPVTFTVVPSANKGFVKVSEADTRYFEYDNGAYFSGLGYNMNYSQVSWTNPVLDNETNFQIMSENGIQLVRIWLSQWGIYGPSWNPWNSIEPSQHGQYIPYTGLNFEYTFPGSKVSMRVNATYNPCMFIGVWKAKPAVKRNTDYRVRIRYKTTDISGPRVAGNPYGFVAKTGGWLSSCEDSGSGTTVTPYQDQNTSDWQILEGSLNTGNSDFLANFYLVMENVDVGKAYVDYVWIEEDLGNGSYGPNIVSKPWMAHHRYMEQRNSYAFDKVLELAEQYDVYLRPVIHEKNEWIFNRIDYSGNFTSTASNDNFYGNWRELTKVRWHQQAWWRYLQARWGYSSHIHSWELLNEGDPNSERHYTLTDEFGKYMHCRAFGAAVGEGNGEKCVYDHPNDHMVSTSNWHSFPKDNFWANPNYPNVDFADVHQYIDESAPLFEDAALMTQFASMQYGAKQAGGAGKPIIRGETGFGDTNSLVKNDTGGIWLHNYIWGGINSGGLIESYWYANRHIYFDSIDHRPIYKTFHNFIDDVLLNNGHYEDAQATVSDGNLRAWGQKDLGNGRAHLWIQNKNHTWKNVVDGVPILAVSGTITISDFQPNQSYTVQWWNPYQPDLAQQIIMTETMTSQMDGAVVISMNSLTTDLAVKIFPAPSFLSVSLPAYWKLDETSGTFYEDFYNNNHYAACSGSCPTPAASPINGGQQFNDTGTGIDVLANPAFDWGSTANFSIEFWMKGVPGQTCANSDEVIIGRAGSNTIPFWSLGCTGTTGYARFQLTDVNGISSTLESTRTITSGYWHHIVGMRDNGVNRLYVNGQEVASDTITYTGGFTSNAALNIGWLNSGNGFHFMGTIDEVALYDRALSATEIKTHYYLARSYDEMCSTPVKIMPLGDSITRGNSSGVGDPAKQISYRKDLWDSLIAGGYRVGFTGTLIHGQFYDGFDPNHEGHSGERDDYLAEHIYDNGGDNWLSSTSPDVILLHIGTNDINWHDPNDVDDLLDEINQYEADNHKSVTVIVARMIHRLNYSSWGATHSFNNTTEVVALGNLANGDKIIVVDMENGAGINYAQYPDGDMWDWGHPYATGYTKMAAVWYDALDDFLPVCVDEPPNITSSPVITATVGQLYTYDVEASGIPLPTYTLAANPVEMTIDAVTGVISWTPLITGSFGVTVEAHNLAGTGTQNFTIDVSAAPVVSPTIAMTTTVNPVSIPEPGGPVTFTVYVGNTGLEEITLTSLVDDFHGNLDGQGDCVLTQSIAVSSFYECSFPATISGDAGMQETDTLTATAKNDDDNTVTGTASATVTITNMLPTITVTKTANPISVPEPGGTITFTVRVGNTSSFDNVTIESLLDSAYGPLTNTVALPNSTCTVPQTITVENSYVCGFTAWVSGNEGDSETSEVIASGLDDDNQPISGSGAVTITIGPAQPPDFESDLKIGKSVTPVWPLEGDTITYTIVVTNIAGDTSSNIVISDVLPTGVTYGGLVSGSPSQGDYTAGSVGVWSGITLTLNSTASLVFTATVDGGTGGNTLVNVTGISSSTTEDPDTSNNYASASVTAATFDLAITKTHEPAGGTIVPGTSVTYSLVVTNAGSLAVNGGRLTDTFFGDLTNISWSCSGSAGTGCTSNGTGNIADVITVPVNGILTYTVVATVSSGATGSLVNVASVAIPPGYVDSVVSNNVATDTVTLTPQADLVINKSDYSDPVTAGQTLTYTVMVTNNGPSDAQGVSVNDTLPAGVSFNGTSGDCSNDPNGVPTCNLNTITAGATEQYVITVTVYPTTTGSVVNTATVSSSTTDPGSGVNSDTETTTVNVITDLEIDKVVNDASVEPGQRITYTVTFVNNGPSTAREVVITDQVPISLSNISASNTGANIVPTGSFSYVWSVEDLDPGKNGTITVGGDVTTTMSGAARFTNTAEISSTNSDSNLDNNSSSVGVGVPEAQMAIGKFVNNVNPAPGETITYTVVVSNAGPSLTTGVVVSDTLPVGVTLVSSSTNKGIYNQATGIWNIDSLGVNEHVTMTVAAVVNNNTTGQIITNTATISESVTSDPVAGNNSDSAPITVTDVDLSVSVVSTYTSRANVSAISVQANDSTTTITYTITVNNNNTADATGVVVSATLPVSVTYVTSSTTSGSSYNPAGGIWNVGTVGAQSAVQISLVVTANLKVGDIISFTVAISESDQTDLHINNNQATEIITIDALPGATLYLPLIFKNFVSGPDLVIDSLMASSNGVTVVIRNAGTTAVNDDFWVDVYFNPTQTPALNKTWQSIAPAGAAWGVAQSLAAGQVLTLTVGGTYYDASKSSSSFSSGATVYGYVDLVNYATTYGAVLESNESNNLSSSVTSTTKYPNMRNSK
ncbi:LamG-like jellyroll fold domain-containing protein [Chloroflexota bacterium]